MESVVEISTRLLRESDDPFWARLRDLLLERGIDYRLSAIAQCFPDDSNIEFGIVVAPDGQVYEFDFEYGRGDITTAARTGVIADWTRMTERWRDRPFRDEVAEAIRLLGIDG